MQENQNFKIVYTIIEKEKQNKSFWLRVGSCFLNRDGSMNVVLDAIPTNGKLHIRNYEPPRNESTQPSRKLVA